MGYSKMEQDGFKMNAMVLNSFFLRRFGYCARGMECLTRERLWHRKNTIRSVLSAQKMYGNESPEFVAEIYRQNSVWNAELAATTASVDFMQAVNDDLEHNLKDQ